MNPFGLNQIPAFIGVDHVFGRVHIIAPEGEEREALDPRTRHGELASATRNSLSGWVNKYSKDYDRGVVIAVERCRHPRLCIHGQRWLEVVSGIRCALGRTFNFTPSDPIMFLKPDYGWDLGEKGPQRRARCISATARADFFAPESIANP
jgi:hypothetical protein